MRRIASLVVPFLAVPAYAGSHGPDGFGMPRAVQSGIPLEVDSFLLELRAAWTTYDAFSAAELDASLGRAATLDYSLLSTAKLGYGVSESATVSAQIAYWWTDGYAAGRDTLDDAGPSSGDPMGPSDLWIEGSWRFLRNTRGDFAFLFGVKLPFGSDDKKLDDGSPISPSDQASTGAVDFRAGVALTNQLTDRLRLDASVERLLHGDNHGFEQGDRWDVGAALHWKLREDAASKAHWTVSAALLMTNCESDDQDGGNLPNTGGTLAWFAPSVSRRLPDGTCLEVELALPVSQELNGEQVETDSRLSIGWSTGF